MNIRIARIEDLAAIVDIYNQSIPGNRSTADLNPIHPQDRMVWFAEHDPVKYPVFVAEIDNVIAGWCSVSAYRRGRMALRFTAEISYYVGGAYQRRGVATELIRHAMDSCRQLRIRNLLAIVLEHNEASVRLLEKIGFEKWGCLPRVADFYGEECGHLYYGMRVRDPVEEENTV